MPIEAHKTKQTTPEKDIQAIHVEGDWEARQQTVSWVQ